jgi:hypothetical protein
VYWLTVALSLKTTGIGLVLLAVGGIFTIVGSVAALVKPERAEAVRAPEPATA